MAEDAAAILVGERDAAELLADDVRDPVDLGDALVDERVVGREQVEDVAILADDAVEEQLGFTLVGFGELVVERRKQQRVGVNLLDVLQPQPLRREPRRHRLGARIGEHPADLLLEHRRRVERAVARRPSAARRPGTVPQMKYDSRDARSTSVTR